MCGAKIEFLKPLEDMGNSHKVANERGSVVEIELQPELLQIRSAYYKILRLFESV